MICLLQMACFVAGIVILVTGKIALTKSNVIEGTPARLIGAVLLAWLPLAMAVGMAIGVTVALSDPDQLPEDMASSMMQYWWVDILVAIFVFATVGAIAAFAKKGGATKLNKGKYSQQPMQPQQPIDPDNPYEPPVN
jgi:hypothetical protein